MKVERLPLAGLVLITPRVFSDERGFFLESFQRERYREAGVDVTFVQDNHSRSRSGALRGLHFQASPGQAKLIRVARGRIFDVAVDIRPHSDTFGRWHGLELDDEQHQQLFIPVGFAHGFCVLSDVADVIYKCDSVYDATSERTIQYDDPDVGVVWPVEQPIVSKRDEAGEAFAAFAARVTKTAH